MRRSLGSTVDVGVFGVSVGISVLFVPWGVFFTERLTAVASAVLGFLTLTTPEPRSAPEPARAAGRPTGAPAPQQFRAERDPGEQ